MSVYSKIIMRWCTRRTARVFVCVSLLFVRREGGRGRERVQCQLGWIHHVVEVKGLDFTDRFTSLQSLRDLHWRLEGRRKRSEGGKRSTGDITWLDLSRIRHLCKRVELKNTGTY